MARYVENKKGFGRLAVGPKARRHMLEIGQFWASQLRASAPRSPTKSTGDVGHYADNITVHSVIATAGHPPLPRVGAQITATVSYASVLEHGNEHVKNPPRPMTKLLDRIRAADPQHRAR